MVKLGIFEYFDVITWDVKKHHFPQDVFFSSKKSSIFGWQKTISKTGAFVLALEVRVKLNCISRWLLFNLYLYSHVNYPNVGNWLLRTTPTNRCDPLPGPLSKENGHPLLSTTQLKKKPKVSFQGSWRLNELPDTWWDLRLLFFWGVMFWLTFWRG